MDPMTIAAIANVLLQAGGQFMNMGQQNDAMSMQKRALAQQQANAKQQMKLAMMKQRDPYGNMFNPRTGNFRLTDLTRGILSAEQGEQQKALTTDATRNRAARERADLRAREGEEEFYNTLNEYRYGDRPDEAQSISDITREIMLARDRGAREPTQAIGRQAIRGLANPNVLSTLLRKSQEGLGGSLEEAVLRGRRLGKEEFRGEQSGRQAELGGWLGKFGDIAGSTPQANLPSGANLVSGVQNLGSNSIQNMISALQNAGSGKTAALSNLARTAQTGGFDLGALGPSVLALGKAWGAQTPATNPADPNSWMTTVTPNATWAMNNDVYGNPYPWNLPDVLEEDRDPDKLEFN